jgi:2-amino-4-hydroxy-6-hydroxymethyldihydropteridine diphosphokinase
MTGGQIDEPVEAIIGLGANQGDRFATLMSAWRLLGSHEQISTELLSRPFISEPVEMDSSAPFVNAAGKVRTTLGASALLAVLHETEQCLGRIRERQTKRYQDRTIDLDLLYYGNACITSSELIVPHPRLVERLFVLAPLIEIDTEMKDPLRGCSVGELHRRLVERIRKGEIASQEIAATLWPEPSDEDDVLADTAQTINSKGRGSR